MSPSRNGALVLDGVDEAAHTFYELFAGAGMVRAGLGMGWKCLFANDFDYKKSVTYARNWGEGTLSTKDVRKVDPSEVPGRAELAWASFPCQDLSLAGMGAGLRGDRSGTFWPFWKLIQQLKEDGRAPRSIVLENVCGTLTSHSGKDFSAIADALSEANYRFGAVVIDAVAFVPQSRPRLFIIAIGDDEVVPEDLSTPEPLSPWHTAALQTAYARLSAETTKRWVWWKLPAPEKRSTRFADLVEENPSSVAWHTPEETARLLGMMSELNLKKVRDAQKTGGLQVGTVYKRTRLDQNGVKVQRAEIRFDEVAGCLRTSSGGSSRQLIVVVHGESVRSRLISSRETARLMGLEDTYSLPLNYNEAYHLTGDGVVVPVVRYLAANLFEPILEASTAKTDKRA